MHTARRFQNGGPSQLFLERRKRTLLWPLIAPYLQNTSVVSALLFLKAKLKHIIDKISPQFCCCFGWSRLPSNYVTYSVFCFCPRDWSVCLSDIRVHIITWMCRKIDLSLSSRLHWANNADWYVPSFCVPMSDLWLIVLFQATYLRHVSSFLKSRLTDQTAMPSSYLNISLIFWMLANNSS